MAMSDVLLEEYGDEWDLFDEDTKDACRDIVRKVNRYIYDYYVDQETFTAADVFKGLGITLTDQERIGVMFNLHMGCCTTGEPPPWMSFVGQNAEGEDVFRRVNTPRDINGLKHQR